MENTDKNIEHLISWSGQEVTYFDPKKKKSTTRLLDKEEKEEVEKYNNFQVIDDNVHAIWHDFQNEFYEEGNPKWIGYEMMEKVRKWAYNHQDVKIVNCDDNVYTSSSLVLIPHRSKYSWHGISVVFIPQCSGEPPSTFFLYNNHRAALLQALLDLNSDNFEYIERSELVMKDGRLKFISNQEKD